MPLTQTQTPAAGSLIGENTVVTVTTSTTGGNTTSCEVEIAVEDNEVPTITAPADLTLSADAGACEATGVALGSATTADNCGVATVENDAPTSFPVGTTTVTWNVTDVNGNSNTAEQIVTIEDNEAPTIAAPAGLTLSADAGACEATGVALGSATTADNCGVATVENDAPASFPVGTTTVTWTVTDVNGNSYTAEQIVTIEDNEAPTIAAPAGLALSADAGACEATGVALGSATTADNCGVATVENDAPASFPVGTTTVTWTVTDVNGNSNTAEQLVTVEDNEAPVVNTNNVNIALSCAGFAEIEPSDIDSGSTDNCGIDFLTADVMTFGTEDLGDNVVTLTATDVNGNSSFNTAIVTILEAEGPDDNVVVTSDLSVNDNGNILIFQNAPSSLGLPASTTLSASLSSGDAISNIQWFVAELPDGEFESIPGATDPTLIVQAQDDLHQEYKAVVTIDGCTISSSINVFSVNVSCGNGGNKVLICHVPPGNPSKMKNICVNFNAVDAILNNSDSFLGSCDFDDKSLEAENNNQETELTIYPNPNGGTFRVKYAGSSSQVIHVYDAQGRKVYSESLADQPANFNMEINLPIGAQGIYFVQILDEFSVIAQAKVAVMK